ncbi:NUDIX hydrolase [Brucella intermedia]|uniref:hypothetical protein n=1 Tax=Brucella intermedia TaxID=94625 RepID=UPI00224A9D82|nr:hypothetical protein [Brucella intermedia]
MGLSAEGVREELDAEVITAWPLGVFERPAAHGEGLVRIYAWGVQIGTYCKPHNEIEEIRWITATERLLLGSVFAECVIPDLVRRDEIDE